MANIYGVQMVVITSFVVAVYSVIFAKKLKLTLLPAFLSSTGLIMIAFGFSSMIAGYLWDSFDAGSIIRDHHVLIYYFIIPGSILYAIGIFIAALGGEFGKRDSEVTSTDDKNTNKQKLKEALRIYSRSMKDFKKGRITKEELKERLRPYKYELKELGFPVKIKEDE